MAATLLALAGCQADDPTQPGVPDPGADVTAPATSLQAGTSLAASVTITPTSTSTTGVPILELPWTGGDYFMEAINESNWVAGTARIPGDRAVLWRGGAAFEVVERPNLTAAAMRGLGLNDAGTVVGEWTGSSGASLPFISQDPTSSTLLPAPPGFGSGGQAEARDIDEAGTIAVYFWAQNNCGGSGSFRDRSAVLAPPYDFASYEPIAGPDCDTGVFAAAIDGGTVAGDLQGPGGFRWNSTTGMQPLAEFNPSDIEGGSIVGTRSDAIPVVPARWFEGLTELLPTLGGTGSGRGTNSLGWVVGSSVTGGGETHAFLWRAGIGIVDLGTIAGSDFSTAADVNDAGYIVGQARNANGKFVPVVWFVDPAAAENQPPEIGTIPGQTVTVGETLEVTPIVTDPEGDPFTLSWSDLPLNATANGSLSFTPTADQAGSDYTVTVTATQDDDDTLFDSETFEVSVLPAAVPSADLQVTVAPITPQQQFLGDVVAYTASVHNAGPDAAPVGLSVELEYRDQAAWGQLPPNAAVNGIWFLDLGEVEAGATVDVPFEVLYHAFGVQAVTATLSGGFDDADPANNVAAYDQVIDLALSTPGVETGGLDVPGAHTTDGAGLAVVGVRIPGALIAGNPEWDLFIPAELTPGDLLPSDHLVTGAQFTPGDQFIGGDQFIPGDQPLPSDPLGPGHWIPVGRCVGRIVIREIQQWDPTGRLLFQRGPTDMHIRERGGATLTLERGAGPGLAVQAEGGTTDADLGLCAQGFSARVGHGDGAEFACGSLTTTVATGEVGVVLADGTQVEVPAGSTAIIAELAGGGFEITAQDGPVTIIRGGESVEVPAGETVTVGGNVPPVITSIALPDAPVAVNTVASLGASFTDGNPADTHTASIDWETAVTAGVVGGSGGAGTVAGGHTYTEPGVYTVEVSVTDQAGATGSRSSSLDVPAYVVVYDPSAGFVTGGGWIDSPAGACRYGGCLETTTGKATFGFVSRYKKGANAPQGNAEFQFQAGDLRFHSSSYQWLVIAGERAQFKGEGGINGGGAYGFLITAIDGALKDSGPDRFRIKIWEVSSGDVVYDNQMDENENGDAATALGGGSIVIHKGK